MEGVPCRSISSLGLRIEFFVLARMSPNMGPKWICSAKYRYIAKWELTREELASALVWDGGVGVGVGVGCPLSL